MARTKTGVAEQYRIIFDSYGSPTLVDQVFESEDKAIAWLNENSEDDGIEEDEVQIVKVVKIATLTKFWELV